MFLNLYGLFCQFLHFFVGQREDVTLFLRYVFDFNLLAVLLGRRVDHADFFRPHGAAHDSRAIRRQCRFVHVKLIRVNRTLHDHFTKAPCGSDKHHLVKAGFGINGEHHARRCEVGAHHPLNTGGERHATVIVTLVHTIRDGAIVKQRSKYMFHCHENGVKTLNVEEGFLLTGKGSVRHIFCSSGGAHRKRGVFVIGGKLCIGFADGVFQLRLEGSVDNPLADLRARFRKLGNIVNIRFIQQFINALVYAALVQKLVKRVGGCGETIRNGNTHSGKVSNHFTQGGIFAPNPVYIIHAELVIPKHQR